MFETVLDALSFLSLIGIDLSTRAILYLYQSAFNIMHFIAGSTFDIKSSSRTVFICNFVMFNHQRSHVPQSNFSYIFEMSTFVYIIHRPFRIDVCSLGLSLGADRLGADRLGADRLGADRLGADRLCADRLGADRLGADRLGAALCEAWCRAVCTVLEHVKQY